VTSPELVSNTKKKNKEKTRKEGKKRKIAPTINRLPKGSVATTM
jgi:hypothetical protein